MCPIKLFLSELEDFPATLGLNQVTSAAKREVGFSNVRWGYLTSQRRGNEILVAIHEETEHKEYFNLQWFEA
jgi:hypothetical protein